MPELGRLGQFGIMLGLPLMESKVEDPKISIEGDSVVFDAGEILIIDSPDEIVMMVGSDIIQYGQNTIKIWSGRPYNIEVVKEDLIQDLDTSSLGDPASKIELTGALDIVRSVSLDDTLAEYGIGDNSLAGKDNKYDEPISVAAGLFYTVAAYKVLSGTAGMLCIVGVAATTAFAVGVLGALAGYAIYNAIAD